MKDLAQAELKRVLNYDPESGVFTWRIPRFACAVGSVAGKPARSGKNEYCRIGINYGMYHAHRLAWLYVYGAWPEQHIDHINGKRSDNRIANLREASPSENSQNRATHANNSSGLTGVVRSRGLWQAQVVSAGKCMFLGRFSTPEEAHAAYLKCKAELHKFNPNPR